MMPISVLIPVATTTATQAPLEMVVEEKSRLLFSCVSGLGLAGRHCCVVFKTHCQSGSMGFGQVQ